MNIPSLNALVPTRCRASRLRPFFVAAILIALAVPVWAIPVITNPYLGITRITDSFTLPAPLDQTPGSGLGTHSGNVNVIEIDLRAPGIGFKLSPDNGAAAGETLTQTTLSFLTQENAQLAVNAHFFNFTTNAAVNTTLTGFAASNGTVYSAFEAAPLANALLPYALTANAPGINISAANVPKSSMSGDADDVGGRSRPLQHGFRQRSGHHKRREIAAGDRHDGHRTSSNSDEDGASFRGAAAGQLVHRPDRGPHCPGTEPGQ